MNYTIDNTIQQLLSIEYAKPSEGIYTICSALTAGIQGFLVLWTNIEVLSDLHAGQSQ